MENAEYTHFLLILTILLLNMNIFIHRYVWRLFVLRHINLLHWGCNSNHWRRGIPLWLHPGHSRLRDSHRICRPWHKYTRWECSIRTWMVSHITIISLYPIPFLILSDANFLCHSPDTFASKVAAIQDKYADASVGNVTGSNAVNVFLGIGVAWTIAAVYHAAKGRHFEVEPGK